MDKYYYFISQLPFLNFKEKARISKTSFLEEANKWLSANAFESLSKTNVNIFSPFNKDSAVIRNYKNFEQQLRRNIASFRNPSKAALGEQLPENLKQILSSGTPLEVEEKLLFLRWRFIEGQEQEHFFDLDFLKLYFIKLQILERLFTFDKKEGTVVFDSLCEVH